jgi:hypothetical protein
MMNDEVAALRNSVFFCSVFIIPNPMDHCFVHRQTEHLTPAVQITSPESFGYFCSQK